jgi:hypothetical protein
MVEEKLCKQGKKGMNEFHQVYHFDLHHRLTILDLHDFELDYYSQRDYLVERGFRGLVIVLQRRR